jgi:bisphosphoglycerate-dependent phosphoglycerate mutase
MTKRIIQQRKRIFIAAEGESEQSFVKWLQQLSDQQRLHIHLDCQTLEGGGYKTMLERAVRE